MRPRLVLCLCALVALVAAPSGAAQLEGGVDAVLKVGDLVDVLDTKVGCFAVTGEGKKGIVCALLNANGPIPRTYAAAIRADGRVYGYVIKANGEPKEVFERAPQAVGGGLALERAGRDIPGRPGQRFGLAGTSVLCEIVRVRSGPAVYRGIKAGCYRSTPGGFGIAVSDTFAGVFRFRTNGQPGPNVWVKFQP